MALPEGIVEVELEPGSKVEGYAMSKRTPGSKYAMKASRNRYLAERARYREKLARRQLESAKAEKEGENNG